MKKSQNFTTLKQSQRLLELGVPADSADMYFQNGQTRPIVRFANSEGFFERNDDCSPCWSVGQLIEIFEICTSCLFERRNPKLSILEDVMSQISEDIIATDECWDFSKLEDLL